MIISNENLWRLTEEEPIAIQIKRRKWRWICHSLRKPAEAIKKQALEWNPQGTRTTKRNIEKDNKWEKVWWEMKGHSDKSRPLESFHRGTMLHKVVKGDWWYIYIYIYIYTPVAVYDGCVSVAFVYWMRLKQFCSSHQGSVPFMAVTVWELFGEWGCLVVVFTALLCLCVQWKVFP